MLRTRGFHGGCEPGARDEAHPVPAPREVLRDGEQGCDVAVNGNGGDDDRRHVARLSDVTLEWGFTGQSSSALEP